MTGKYTLGLCSTRDHATQEEATLTLTATDLVRYRLDPSESLVGATVELTVSIVPAENSERQPAEVKIQKLSAERITHYLANRPTQGKTETIVWCLQLATPVRGGSIILLPDTYLELNLTLSVDEYRQVRKLPAETRLQVDLRPLQQPFRDLSLTWWGTLDDPRLLPPAYCNRMIDLARAMIGLFDGDIDVICHGCGLTTPGRETGDSDWPMVRQWQRDYFATDVYEPDAWEAPYRERVAAIDTLLAERYGNQLVSGGPSAFYDLLEASTWQSKRRHPVDEMTVGLRTGNVMQGGVYLPSIVIEARSVGGNRKGCEAFGAVLMAEATRLFGIHFSQWTVAADGMGQAETGRANKLNSTKS